MEACGSAHHWARWLSGLGITQSKSQWHQTLAFDAPGTPGVAYPRYGNSATDLSLAPRTLSDCNRGRNLASRPNFALYRTRVVRGPFDGLGVRCQSLLL
jgi:hypothetical protein